MCMDMNGEDWDANFMAHFVDGDEDGDEGAGEDEAGDDDMEVERACAQLSHVVKELDKIKPFWGEIEGIAKKQMLWALHWTWLHLLM